MDTCNQRLFEFIEKSPTAYHAANTIAHTLREHGFAELSEGDRWSPGAGKYFVMRGGSSIIAFVLPEHFDTFGVMATHTDSPSFRIKGTDQVCGAYTRLRTEKYGGAILPSWLDRPLSVAGCIVRKTGDCLTTELWDAGRDLCIIPSVAPHLDRESASGKALDPKTDLLPLFGETGTDLKTLPGMEDLLTHDLFLYNRQSPALLGAQEELIASPRLDNLQCTYGAMTGLLAADPKEHAAVFCAFDNEEVGSLSKQGADSDFLETVLRRIVFAAGGSEQTYYQMVARSFLLSADNAHAVHPDHPELADQADGPRLNGGIVIKYSAARRYTTDALSAAVVIGLCERAGVPHQDYHNRADLPGGSTLGSIALSHVSLTSADVGLAQLAMHSAYETAGSRDTAYFCRFAQEYFERTIQIQPNGKVEIQ